MASLFAFLHHLAAFALFAALVVELISMREVLTVGTARRLQIADMVFGIAAGILLVVGLLRVYYFEKGATYYFHTWTFVAKLTLFLLVGIASIVPTLEFLRWRKTVKQGQAPSLTPERVRTLRTIIHLELAGVVLIILMAALMAKGVGLLL
jgi:putative membrane protein